MRSYIIFYLSFSLSLACQKQEKLSNNDLSIATQEYAVLAEKTLSYQADFDLESWSFMLADNVEFSLPFDNSKTNFVGKDAAITAWKNWKTKNKILKVGFSDFTQIPVSSQKTMKVFDLSGIYVFSFFNGTIFYTNGTTSKMKMNYCFHYNEAKMIDRYYAFYDNINFTQD